MLIQWFVKAWRILLLSKVDQVEAHINSWRLGFHRISISPMKMGAVLRALSVLV